MVVVRGRDAPDVIECDSRRRRLRFCLSERRLGEEELPKDQYKDTATNFLRGSLT